MTALHVLAGAAAVLAVQGIGLVLLKFVRHFDDAGMYLFGVTFWFIWLAPWLISRHRHLRAHRRYNQRKERP